MQNRRGLLLAAGAGISWGTTVFFSSFLFGEGLDPLSVASTRMFLATVIFFLYILMRHPTSLKITPKHLLILIPAGFIGVSVFNITYLYTIKLVGASIAVALLYTSPIFVVLIARLVLKERLSPVKIISLSLAFSGVVMVVQAFNILAGTAKNTAGILTGLGAGFAFALLSVFGKVLLQKINYLTATFYMIFFGSLFLAFIRPPWVLAADLPAPLLFHLGGLVVISTVLPHYLYILGLQHLEAGKASIAVAIEPVAAIFIAFFFLGERLALTQYIGVLFVLSAVLLLGSATKNN